MSVPTPSPFDVVDLIRPDVAAFFSVGVQIDTSSISRIRNPYSDVYRIRVELPGRAAYVYLKVPHHTPQNRSDLNRRLATEFRVMEMLSKRWNAEDAFGVVAPIAFYPDIPALLTSEATGRTLRERYRTSARRIGLSAPRHQLVQCVRRCGEWLSAFQQETDRGTVPFDVSELLKYCEVRIKLLIDDKSSGFSTQLAARLVSQVQRTSDTDLADGTLICGRHNDFAGHNIISHGETVRVIDFSMYDTGASAYDVCNFWLELEMLKYDWTYSSYFLDELQSLFLEGYGNIGPDDAAFSLARVRYSLNRLLTALSGSHGWRPDARYRRRAAEVSYDWLAHFAKHGK